MDFLKSRLKKFDIHIKTLDGVNQQTLFGAFVTVVTVVVVILLLVSEIRLFVNKELISHMIADTSAGVEAVKIEFDVEFLRMKCDKISFIQEITRGSVHSHEPDHVDRKSTVDNNGCNIFGSIVTDKVGGNFRFGLSVLPDQPEPLDISHKVNKIYFHPSKADKIDSVPSISYPLHGQMSSVPIGVGIHQYVVQVVPTRFKKCNSHTIDVNQYSFTERQVDLDQLYMGVFSS